MKTVILEKDPALIHVEYYMHQQRTIANNLGWNGAISPNFSSRKIIDHKTKANQNQNNNNSSKNNQLSIA
jgi:hypothetical protein